MHTIQSSNLYPFFPFPTYPPFSINLLGDPSHHPYAGSISLHPYASSASLHPHAGPAIPSAPPQRDPNLIREITQEVVSQIRKHRSCLTNKFDSQASADSDLRHEPKHVGNSSPNTLPTSGMIGVTELEPQKHKQS